jgi:hypothetical protein
VEKALREAGARVVAAGYLESGLYTTVHPDLSAAAAVPVLSFASDQRLWQISSMRIVVPAGIALAVLFFLLGAARAETLVDLELILAVDVSMSMDPEEQRLQRGGYIAAFRDPDVIKGIQSGSHGRIAVTYIEWAGPQVQTVLIPWRLIDGPSTAEAFVAELSSKEYSRYHWTSISAALAFSHRQFGTSDYRGIRASSTCPVTASITPARALNRSAT